MEIIVISLILIIAALVVLLIKRQQPQQQADNSQSILLMQQHIEALRTEVNQSLRNTSDTLSFSIKNNQDALYQSLKLTTDTVNQQLGVVTNQLSSVTQQLQNNTGQMGTRLDNAAKVIGDVKTQLGELGERLQSVSKLEELLSAPKLRGGLGELLLEDLLKQVLPTSTYDMQYSFKNGQTVDAIIKLSGGKVPVDSKFPLENFRKMVEAKSEQEKKVAYRTFVSDVKKHVDAIHDKYIVPDEGTFDFALMYIPAENIYYETIIKDETLGENGGLHNYAIQRHVVPVSPNSFYAHLMVIVLGFKGLQIEDSAKEIIQSLSRLNTELEKFSDVFQTLGKQLGNAKNNFDEADKKLDTFTQRLKNVANQALPQKNEKLIE